VFTIKDNIKAYQYFKQDRMAILGKSGFKKYASLIVMSAAQQIPVYAG
jgi:hypothetical protein